MLKRDFIMVQIEELGKAIARLVFRQIYIFILLFLTTLTRSAKDTLKRRSNGEIKV